MEIPPTFDEATKKLQISLATYDPLDLSDIGSSSSLEFLVKKLKALQIRMEKDKNHARAHVHISYGRNYHAATYSLDTAELLVGNVASGGHDRDIQRWIKENQEVLFELWEVVQSGKNHEEVLAKLPSNN